MRWKVIAVYEANETIKSETVARKIYSKERAKEKARQERIERNDIIQTNIQDDRPIKRNP